MLYFTFAVKIQTQMVFVLDWPPSPLKFTEAKQRRNL